MTPAEQAELKEWQDRACNLRHELNVAERLIAQLKEENRRLMEVQIAAIRERVGRDS